MRNSFKAALFVFGLSTIGLIGASPVSAQQMCTLIGPGNNGGALLPNDLACGDGAYAAGGGTVATGSTAFGTVASADGAGSTSVGSNAGSGATAAGVTSIGANTNRGVAAGIFSTAIGAGDATATAARSSGSYAVAIGGGDASNSGATAAGTQSVAIGSQSSASAGLSTAVGAVSTASGASSTALGNGSTASAANSTAIGTGATATAANSVAIGAGSTATAANTVSMGAAGNQRRVTNVAAGVDPTDAVNVAQLNAAVGNAGALQTQLNSLTDYATESRREARQGVAAAIAMGSAPMPSAPGKITYAVNTGFFKSETAGGVSFAYRFDTARPMAFNFGYAYGGGSSHGLRAGIAGEF